MNGIVIFADNKIFSPEKENRLFERFRQDNDFSVLPIDNLFCFESTVKSTSTFRACIIDWDFENVDIADEDFIGVQHPQRTPMSILMDNPLYTLLYIYSERDIPDNERAQLEQKFGNKIHFKTKQDDIDLEYNTIKADIQNFEAQNSHMDIPFCWSQAINQSAQKIFRELESASSFWIKEVRDTAIEDGGDPATEIIDLFSNLINEELVQNINLRQALNNPQEGNIQINAENTARLYRRIYYSKLIKQAPIMTGDIFKFSEEEFGILITPECELADQQKERARNSYDFLVINKTSSANYQKTKQTSFNKNPNSAKEIFNNGVISRHVLISFPFTDNVYNQIALIEFNTDFRTMPKIDSSKHHIIECRTNYKLNAPYIHQLRQRFVSYFGKYGVPAIPNSLREYNLKQQE